MMEPTSLSLNCVTLLYHQHSWKNQGHITVTKAHIILVTWPILTLLASKT